MRRGMGAGRDSGGAGRVEDIPQRVDKGHPILQGVEQAQYSPNPMAVIRFHGNADPDDAVTRPRPQHPARPAHRWQPRSSPSWCSCTRAWAASRWGDFPQRLCAATGCPGLVYDRVGYGQSSPMTRAAGARLSAHRAASASKPHVLRALVPDTPYVLIGHSDGGSIALIHAADRPVQLRAAVTEAAHVFVEDASLAASAFREADAAFDAGKLAGLVRYHGDKTKQTFKAWSETGSAPISATGTSKRCCPGSPARCWSCRATMTSTARRAQVEDRCGARPAAPPHRCCCRTADIRRTRRTPMWVLAQMRAFIDALRPAA